MVQSVRMTTHHSFSLFLLFLYGTVTVITSAQVAMPSSKTTPTTAGEEGFLSKENKIEINHNLRNTNKMHLLSSSEVVGENEKRSSHGGRSHKDLFNSKSSMSMYNFHNSNIVYQDINQYGKVRRIEKSAGYNDDQTVSNEEGPSNQYYEDYDSNLNYYDFGAKNSFGSDYKGEFTDFINQRLLPDGIVVTEDEALGILAVGIMLGMTLLLCCMLRCSKRKEDDSDYGLMSKGSFYLV